MKKIQVLIAGGLLFSQGLLPVLGRESVPGDPQGSVFAKQLEVALRSGDLSQLRPFLCEAHVPTDSQTWQDESYRQLMAYLKSRAGWSLKRIRVSSLPKGDSAYPLNLVPAYGLEVVNFANGKRCRFAIGVVDGKYQVAENSFSPPKEQ